MAGYIVVSAITDVIVRRHPVRAVIRWIYPVSFFPLPTIVMPSPVALDVDITRAWGHRSLFDDDRRRRLAYDNFARLISRFRVIRFVFCATQQTQSEK
jgi:hypothetical protein